MLFREQVQVLPSTDVEVLASVLQGKADVGLVSFGILEVVAGLNIFPGFTANQMTVI